MAAEGSASLRAADGMKQLRSGGRGGTDNMQWPAAPMRRHLSSAAGRIGGRAHGLQHHVVRRNAKRQAQSAIAIVREEPVIPRPKRECGANLQSLMTGGRNLEENF